MELSGHFLVSGSGYAPLETFCTACEVNSDVKSTASSTSFEWVFPTLSV